LHMVNLRYGLVFANGIIFHIHWKWVRNNMQERCLRRNG
jgi:hypothetical protein